MVTMETETTMKEWESHAFKRTRYKRKKAVNLLSIDITDPEKPIITAPIGVIRRISDSLMLPNFVELPVAGGYARTWFNDSIPNAARQAVNAILTKTWRKTNGNKTE
jgi:hypothetical protein